MFSYCETVRRRQLPTPYALRRMQPRTCPPVSEVTLLESRMYPPDRGQVGRVAVAAWRKCTLRKRERKMLKTDVAPPSPRWDFAWLHRRPKGGRCVATLGPSCWMQTPGHGGARPLLSQNPWGLPPPLDLTIPGADFRITRI